MTESIDAPTLLRVHAEGKLTGSTRSYRKTLGDMGGVYRDSAAYAHALDTQGAEHLVYSVDEQRYNSGPGSLIVGTSCVLPGRYGDEFAVTRGHLHEVSDRAELYYCLSGTGVMLLETVDGRSEAVPLSPGDAVNVPGEWIHRSVNTGDVPFVTLFCYAADAGQNYEIIADANGMRDLIVTDGDGWTTRSNPDHTGYQLTGTK
ncbi:glucose-6-phosphate isomerase family protein [Salinibacterium sp. G-O1]|uniref:glucose-6-phosphate isomerase family protein n=1 Tax=Salinibacterium sp. G-O1 TaxID=3046208 RepID=UPI0024BA682D|nr:glucose-6-phosphate isomerase family protein [Salinibacterium sp. G-O1]MDJ0334054.1 glucose-6-phosphate isomerase family protein [Salinibacterium sp. G-O1]